MERLHLKKHSNHHQLQDKAIPSKLFRLELSSSCNMNCEFCCWEKPKLQIERIRLLPSLINFLCEACVATGCRNFNITGGEPLLLPLDYLCETIKLIRSIPDVNEIWITTNGAGFIDDNLCEHLYSAGLREAAVSIAAETDSKYLKYTGGVTTLTNTLEAIKNAHKYNIRVRVHVPLNPTGVNSYTSLNTLISRLKEVNVDTLYYFGLHTSEKINALFENLYIDPQIITDGFSDDPQWSLCQTESGRYFFTDGNFRVMVPRPSIYFVTDNCKRQRCGFYCQGIYAAYLVPIEQGWAIRACHRNFPDQRNLFPLPLEWLENGDWNRILAFLKNVWRYAYEKE